MGYILLTEAQESSVSKVVVQCSEISALVQLSAPLVHYLLIMHCQFFKIESLDNLGTFSDFDVYTR